MDEVLDMVLGTPVRGLGGETTSAGVVVSGAAASSAERAGLPRVADELVEIGDEADEK